MLVKDAAKIIGVTKSQITWLIRKGRLKATKIPNPFVRWGHHYEISEEEVERYNKQKSKGFPKGKKRTGVRGTKLKEETDAKTSQKKKGKNSKTIPTKTKARKRRVKKGV